MNAALRRCLLDLDVPGAMRLWREAQPHLPQPATQYHGLIALHMARTATQTIPPRARFYSHRWLVDHGYPSKLPDHLKPRAERTYPRKVEAVGIAIGLTRMPVPGLRALGVAVRSAMEDAVKDCFAMGDTAKAIVWPRMMEARAKAYDAAGFGVEEWLAAARRERERTRNAVDQG